MVQLAVPISCRGMHHGIVTSSSSTTTIIALILILLLHENFAALDRHGHGDLPKSDVDLLEFPLNLEYLEAEFFSWGAFGRGLDAFAPNLTKVCISRIRTLEGNSEDSSRICETTSKSKYSVVVPYVGANSKLQHPKSKRLMAGLLGVESGQDAVLRALLYERASVKVKPYGITVAEFTDKISNLRNKLGKKGVKDEGDEYSVAYDRTPEEILRIVYGSGKESQPGGFYPKGAR
ncbi:hypothetical protein ACS0TY_029879 [Phlomoides rotata]